MDKTWLTYSGIRKLFIFLVSITVIQGIAIIMQGVWLAKVVAHFFNQKEIEDANLSIFYFVMAFLIRAILQQVKEKIVFRFSEKTGKDLRKKVIDHLFLIGPRVIRKLGTGNTVTLLIEGISQVKNYLSLFSQKFIQVLVIPIMIISFVWFLDRLSGIVLAVATPILITFMILLGMAAQKKADMQFQSHRILANHFVDSLRGLQTLKYLGISKSHSNRIQSVSDRYRKSTMSTLKVAFLSSFALDFFTMLSVATIAVFLGLRLIEGELTLGPALTILILAPEYFLPIREIGADFHATLNGQKSAKKLHSILEMAPYEKEQGSIRKWTKDSIFSFENASIQHDQQGPASLKNVSFAVKGFQKIGIVGSSGAGKSTISELISGFLQVQKGGLSINGQTFTHLQRKDWQSQVVYIPQHPYIFQDTFKRNIAFYYPNASDHEIWQAAQKAGIANLYEEYADEVLGDGGRSLSGGQIQRVAIARAFLVDRPILILDEPTAHLDVETEMDIKLRLLKLFEDKLVFLATHRLHWMEDMDQVLFLRRGVLVEQGTHEELIHQQGDYYEMVSVLKGRLQHERVGTSIS
ncbi:thiol reductant ABC exporter subunit CydD [Bacillaceae bacterium S4-13-56]